MLRVDHVSKTYAPPSRWLRPLVRSAVKEPVHALRDVTLTVAQGEVVGLIGPNGAGKTTLLKIISTLLEPTEGHATVDGFDTTTQANDVCRRLGLVLEGDQGLYDRLTGRQNLEFYGMLAGMSRRRARTRADELFEQFELDGRDKLVFGYSAGMKVRLSICRCLMADPPLIVLDEPTRSLDPLASRYLLSLLRDLADQGRAVLMSSHRLDEVAALSDRIVALIHGQVRYEGRADEVEAGAASAITAMADMLEREDQRR